MAMQDNWFDRKHGPKMKSATAEQALEMVAKDPKLVAAVRDALKLYDEKGSKPGWGGPTRTQAVRTAIAVTISEDDESTGAG